MKEDPTYESHFQSQLASAACQDRVAAPTTIQTLTDSVRDYLSSEQVDLVVRAYEYADLAHKGQSRRTGHAYITHPLAVAQILADMRLDHETLMAALLHDVIEDSDVTIRDLHDLGFHGTVLYSLDLLTHKKGVPYMEYITLMT